MTEENFVKVIKREIAWDLRKRWHDGGERERGGEREMA